MQISVSTLNYFPLPILCESQSKPPRSQPPEALVAEAEMRISPQTGLKPQALHQALIVWVSV